MLKIFDKNHNAIGHIVKYKDCKIESELSNGDKTLSFTYLAKHHNLENEMYVRTKDDEYVIKEVPATTGNFPQIVAVLNLEDLQKDMWEKFSVTDSTIDEAARPLLAGTGWIIGECDVIKHRNAGMIQVSTLEAIQKLCIAFMCEPVFDTINKKVSFYNKRGEDKGAYFISGLNLKKLQKKSTSYDYYTRIIPIGANGLTIESANDGKNYLENYQYSNKVLTYIWKDESYTDPQALKEDAELKLNDLSKPERAYSADIYNLAKQKIGYEVLSYGLGDTIILIDRETGTREKQRIVKMVEYPQDHSKDTCEIANTLLTFEEMQQKVQSAADIINYTITGDGRYTGTINVSDILHFEQGVAGSQTISGINGNIATMQGDVAELKGKYGSLEVNFLTAEQAELKYATIESLNVVDQTVHSIQGDYAEFKTVTSQEVSAQRGIIDNLSGELSTYKTQVAGQFTAFDADITNLKAKDAELETALIGTAKVTDLEAIRTRTQTLETTVADINTLVNGNLTSDNIQSMVITGDKFTMENGFIKSAMIDTLDASKITGLDINTTKLTVHSDDGKSTWTDNTIQISDAARVRVQIGEDAAGDYNIYIWDDSGNLMWNATGATSAGLNDGIIKDVAVAADANIAGSKLDIESVIQEVNGATTVIKGTRIQLDTQGQTLDVAFNTLKTYAEGVNSKTDSNTTAISVAQGQISTLISNTTIVKDGKTVQLKDAFNSTVADVSSIKTTLNEHTSLIDQQSGEILAVTTKANTIESDLNGTKQTVSAVQSDLSGTKSRVSTVESGLDGLKSRVTATETSLSKKADGTTVDSLTSRVATAESTINGFQVSLTATNKTVSDNYTALNSKIDGIEIGGRNLLPKSKMGKTTAISSNSLSGYGYTKGLVNTDIAGRTEVLRLKSSTNYVISFTAWCGANTQQMNVDLYPDTLPEKVFTLTTTPTRYAFSVYSNNADMPNGCLRFFRANGFTENVYITDILVEQGTKASQTWTPAPEDTDSILNTHTEQLSTHDTRITAAENAISLKVSTSDYNAYKTTVNNEIASAKSRLSTAESSITAMQGQIALKVSQTDIDTAIQNLQVGGRNIALKTSTEKTLTGNNISNQCVSIYNMSKDWVEFAGKYIVISFDYTFSNDAVCTNSSYTNACIGIGMGASTWNRPAAIPAPSVAKSGHVIKSFFVPTNVSSHSFIQARLDYVTGTCTISNLKFELGTKATDWTPAPEDIDASITAVDAKFANYSTTTQMTAAITAAKDSITQSVSSTYATKASVDTVSGKVTNLTSRVQTAESKLTKDSLVTTIGTYYATQTYAENIKATADSAKKEVYATFNGFGDSKAYCLLCQIKTNAPYINTPTVIEINQRGYGYSLCEIKFTPANNTDPTLQSIRKTGTPEWRIVKTATSTWDVYVKKSEAYDVITVVGFTKGAVPSVTWKCTNADLPSGTTLATQLAGMYGVDSTSGGTSGSNALITSGAAHSAISSVQTIATQTADKFNWLVKSGTSSTNFELTDRTATLVANAINLKGLVTFSGLDSAAQSKINTIDSINSFKFFTSNYSQPQSTLDSWAAEGKDAGNWTVAEGTAGVRVGDMAAIRCYNTTTSAYVYILIKVTAISSATVLKGISHGYIDPNATAAAATAQSTANTANTTANTAKTNAATAQSTANTAKTNAATAQSTADAAKSAAATAQSTANTAKTTADAAKSWTDTNGANMTNLRNMVLKWTNNAVSTSTTIQGGWIATNTITAEKIALGDFTNYCTVNPGYPATMLPTNIFGGTKVSGIADTGSMVIRKVTESQQYLMFCNYTPFCFNAGDEIYFSGNIPNYSSTDCSAAIRIWFYKENKNNAATVVLWSGTLKKNTWNKVSGSIKITNSHITDARYFVIGVDTGTTGHAIGACDLLCRKKESGQLIVDGTITAAKIVANAITAEKIAANAVTAAKIATDAIKSRNYAYSSGNYSTAGTFLDLSNGVIRSKNFGIDASGNAYFKGNLAGASGSFSGTVTSTSGNIGGWVVSDGCISTWRNGSKELTNIDHKDPVISLYSDGSLYAVQGNSSNDDIVALIQDGNYTKIEGGRLEASNARMVGNFTFKDYSGSMRRPLGATSTDGSRAAYLTANLSNGIKVNGQWNVAGASFTSKTFTAASSDIRLKTNICPTEVEALPLLNQIGIYQFDWKRDGVHQKIGFIADYLEQQDSNLSIGGGYDEYGMMDEKVVNDFYLLGYVVKGIQEICTWTANYAAETDRALASVRADLDYTRNMAISNQQRITCLEAQTQADNQSTQAQITSMQAQLQQALNRIAEQEKLIRQLQAAAG